MSGKRKQTKARQEEGLADFAVEASKAHRAEHDRFITWNWRLCKMTSCRERQAEYEKKFVRHRD